MWWASQCLGRVLLPAGHMWEGTQAVLLTPAYLQHCCAAAGESEALRQLRTFLSHARGGSSPGTPAPAAAAGRDGARRAPGAACGSSFASNIAPWLATGCLSPRYMHEEAQRVLSGSGGAAGQGVHSSSSGGGGALDWVNFELLWRDFFRRVLMLLAGGWCTQRHCATYGAPVHSLLNVG